MAKTSKIVPQKEEAPSSLRTSKSKKIVPPCIEDCIPGPFKTSSDFKIKKPSSVLGRCEPMSRDISLITDIEKVKIDFHWGEAVQVEIPSSKEDITTHKAEVADAIPPHIEETLEEGLDAVPEPTIEHDTICADEHLVGAFEGSSSEALRGREEAPIEVDAIGDLQPGLSFSPGKIRDAENWETPDVGVSQGEDDAFGDIFAGVEEDADLDAPVVFEEAVKLQKQVTMLYDQAFSKLRAKLTHCEEELEKLASESNELNTLYARREEELNSLRARLEKVIKERANFIEQASAFDKLKSELLRCEAKLCKALNGEKSLRLLCDKKTKELIHLRSELNRSHDYEGNLEKQRKIETLEHLRGEANQVNYECNKLKAQIDAYVVAKRNTLANASSLEIQLRNARESNLVQTSRIAKLETNLLKMKAEVVDARAEAEEVRTKANKKVAIYLKDAAEARTKLRGASD
ncbi:uncharacterized protein [Nicotiana sylvestris]|uniref:uncharacterized protein n=1 Tax=Nicotiana sylvestris TaxID=4096 RepID=UPI00388C9B5E